MNLKKTVNHLTDNRCSNQPILGDYNSSMNRDLDYVGCLQDLHQVSREFLFGLLDESVYIFVYRLLHPYDQSYTWKVHNSQKRSRIDIVVASQNLVSGVTVMKPIWNQSS